MRRIEFEVDYEPYWQAIFGEHRQGVEIVEALHCFKCDRERLAVVVRLRLLDPALKLGELVADGPVTTARILGEEGDGSVVAFLEGDPPITGGAWPQEEVPYVMAGTPVFVGPGRMRFAVLVDDGNAQSTVDRIAALGVPHRVIAAGRLGVEGTRPLAALTSRQREILVTAFAMGYYEVPRRIQSQELADHVGLDKSTVVEHLRKAERTILQRLVGDLPAGWS